MIGRTIQPVITSKKQPCYQEEAPIQVKEKEDTFEIKYVETPIQVEEKEEIIEIKEEIVEEVIRTLKPDPPCTSDTWNGHYYRDGQRMVIRGQEFVIEDDEIEGDGEDELGDFEWFGSTNKRGNFTASK